MSLASDKPAAFQGTYSNLTFVKTRSVAVVSVEIPIEEADAFVAAFGTPRPGAEVPVALARIDPTASKARPARTHASQPSKRRWADLSPAQQAGIRCEEPAFAKFLTDETDYKPNGPKEAAESVRELCGVSSRKLIAESPVATAKWVELDARYQLWLQAL